MASVGSIRRGGFSVVGRSHGLAAEFFGQRKISCAVDATLGGGRDALFLASLLSEDGKVYGFDIQAEAVRRSRGLFEKNGLSDRCEFFNAGHENMSDLIPRALFGNVGCVFFNLGWLPGSDKSVATRPSTTVAAIRAAVELMDKSRGFLSVAAYRAHPGGREEFEAVGELFEREIPFGECEISDPADAGSPALFYARFGRGR